MQVMRQLLLSLQDRIAMYAMLSCFCWIILLLYNNVKLVQKKCYEWKPVSEFSIFMWVLKGDEYQYWCEVTNVACCQALLCSGESLHNSSVGFYSVQFHRWQYEEWCNCCWYYRYGWYKSQLASITNHTVTVTHTLMEHPVSLLYLVHFRINMAYYMRNLLEDSIWQYLSDMYYNDLKLQVEPL